MKKILVVVAALAAMGLSACSDPGQTVTIPATTDQGTPFLEQYIRDIQNPPKPTKQPESWVDLMLPPEEMP